MPLMMFYQFATIKTELGVEPGLTINMLTWDNLKLGGALTELTDMKTQALSNSLKQITVQEYGNAVSASELLIRSSFLDVMQNTTTLLGRDYALVLDTELRDCALTGMNRVYASKGDGTKVAARKDLDETCKLKVATPDIREAAIKEMAILRSAKAYILADSTKFGQVAPVTFSELDAVDIITTKLKDATFNKYKNIVEVAK